MVFYKWMGYRRANSEPGDELELVGGRAGRKPAITHSLLSLNMLGLPLTNSCLAGWVFSCRYSFSLPLPWRLSSFSAIFILQLVGLWLLVEGSAVVRRKGERLDVPSAALLLSFMEHPQPFLVARTLSRRTFLILTPEHMEKGS